MCQASSANAIGLAYSRCARYDYFPIDEQHPPTTRILQPFEVDMRAAGRLHRASILRNVDREPALPLGHERARRRLARVSSPRPTPGRSHLFGYTLRSAAARACLNSVAADFGGHEVMFVVAPDTATDIPTLELAQLVGSGRRDPKRLQRTPEPLRFGQGGPPLGRPTIRIGRNGERSGCPRDLGAACSCGRRGRSRVALRRNAVAARSRSASAAARPGAARRCRRNRRAWWRFRRSCARDGWRDRRVADAAASSLRGPAAQAFGRAAVRLRRCHRQKRPVARREHGSCPRAGFQPAGEVARSNAPAIPARTRSKAKCR